MTRMIDLTPTWGGLVRKMIAAHAEMSRNDYGQVKEVADLQEEFIKMAEAADMWNEHCKLLKSDEEEAYKKNWDLS